MDNGHSNDIETASFWTLYCLLVHENLSSYSSISPSKHTKIPNKLISPNFSTDQKEKKKNEKETKHYFGNSDLMIS